MVFLPILPIPLCHFYQIWLSNENSRSSSGKSESCQGFQETMLHQVCLQRQHYRHIIELPPRGWLCEWFGLWLRWITTRMGGSIVLVQRW